MAATPDPRRTPAPAAGHPARQRRRCSAQPRPAGHAAAGARAPPGRGRAGMAAATQGTSRCTLTSAPPLRLPRMTTHCVSPWSPRCCFTAPCPGPVTGLRQSASVIACQRLRAGRHASLRSSGTTAGQCAGCLQPADRCRSGDRRGVAEWPDAPALRGRFDDAQALSRLLVGSGLRPRFIDARRATLEPAPAPADGGRRTGLAPRPG